MSLLRFLMLMSLIVWLGGLIFFAFVLAPTVFSVLPTRHMAGSVVSSSLSRLHWLRIICGIVFLVSSMTCSRLTTAPAHPLAARPAFVCLLLVLPLMSQFVLSL